MFGFDRCRGLGRVGRDRVEVEFHGVGAGVLEQSGVAQPSTDVDAVEAGDDGYVDTVASSFDQCQVGIGPGLVPVDVWEERARFVAVVMVGREEAVDLTGLVLDLFLEQRRQHDRADACGVELHESVEMTRDGPR